MLIKIFNNNKTDNKMIYKLWKNKVINKKKIGMILSNNFSLDLQICMKKWENKKIAKLIILHNNKINHINPQRHTNNSKIKRHSNKY